MSETALKNPGETIKINKREYWIICSDRKVLIIDKLKLEWKKSTDIVSFINWNGEFLKYKFD